MGRRAGEDAKQTRARILDAAIELFSKSGFASTSMSDLAGAIGMTQGVLYWHFKGKEDLLIASIDELERRLGVGLVGAASETTEAIPSDDVVSLTRFLIDRVAGLVASAPSYFAFVGIIAAESTGRSARIEEALRAAFRRVSRLVEELLRQGIREGKIDESTDVPCVAQMFVGLYMGAIMHQRLFRDELPYDRARPALVEMLHASLFAPHTQ